MLRCTAMEKSGRTSWSFGRCVAFRSPGVGEDARVLALGAVVQDEDLVAAQRGEAEAQLRAAEERPELLLEREEARVRDDRLLVDQVPLERREHLLIGHLDRLEDREAAEDEVLRRQDLAQEVGVQQVSVEASPDLL